MDPVTLGVVAAIVGIAWAFIVLARWLCSRIGGRRTDPPVKTDKEIEAIVEKAAERAAIQAAARTADEINKRTLRYEDGLPTAGEIVRSLFQHGLAHERAGRYPQAIAIYQEAAAHSQSRSQTVALNLLIGNCLLAQGQLDEAENRYREVERLAQGLNEPAAEGATLGNLALVYQSRAEFGQAKEENLQKAVATYQRVLALFPQDRFPQDWAMTQNNLGNAYRGLSEVKDKEANLGLAIAAYGQALRVRTYEAFPVQYGMTHYNLGNAYGGLSEVGDKEANLGLAIAAYGQAFRVYTYEAFPVGYAMTQNNLGNAYGDLAEARDKEANLERAIIAYGEALRVYSYDAFPVSYAGTQNNLGTAYRGLAEVRDRVANLGKAIAAYQEAIKVYTLAAFPVQYAGTTVNIGRLHLQRGDLGAAERTFAEAARVFREQGMVDWANRSFEALKAVQEQMRRGG